MSTIQRGRPVGEQLLVLWTLLLEGYVPVAHIVADVDELVDVDDRWAAPTRSRRRAIRAAAAALLGATSAPLPHSAAQVAPAGGAEVSGAILVQVTDTSINPLPGEVVLRALGLGVRLSGEGTVLVENVPDGLYLVEARHQGHAPATRLARVAGDTARIDVVLSPAPDAAPTPDAPDVASFARARLHYFIEQSATMTAGVFITRGEIQRRRARTATALLHGIPHVELKRDGRGRTIVRSRRAAEAGCADGMLVLVDGADATIGGGIGVPSLKWVGPTAERVMRVSYDAASASQTPTLTGRRVSDIDRVSTSSVVAVEVYPWPGGAPPEFRLPGAECGAVVIWTAAART